MTIRPNDHERFVEIKWTHPGGMLKAVSSRELWVKGTALLLVIAIGFPVLISVGLFYSYRSPLLSVCTALLPLLVLAPQIWFRFWVLQLEKSPADEIFPYGDE